MEHPVRGTLQGVSQRCVEAPKQRHLEKSPQRASIDGLCLNNLRTLISNPRRGDLLVIALIFAVIVIALYRGIDWNPLNLSLSMKNLHDKYP